MEIVKRDIQIMQWILEQKFMTEGQVKRVFWKGVLDTSREAFRRLNKLEKAGYLKRSKSSFYRKVLYMVAGRGARQVRCLGEHQGLGDAGFHSN